ncbi:MBOAT_2 domain-containing protein, partial [Haematococcus lacustris]
VFPGPPDLDGRTVHNKLFVCGLFSDELESHVLSVLNLRVTCRGSHVLHTSPERICTWELPAAATDIQVSDLEGGWVQLSLGCSDGGLLLARLLLPRLPGSGPADITQTHLPTDSASGGERLQPQLRLHSGAISCVDTQPDTQAILTVGVDGAICVLPPDLAASAATDGSAAISAGEGPGHHAPWRRSRGGLTSLTAGRWADTNVFITVGSPGGLMVYTLLGQTFAPQELR